MSSQLSMSNCRKIRQNLMLLIRKAHALTCFTIGGEFGSHIVAVKESKCDKTSTEQKKKSDSGYGIIKEGKYYRDTDVQHSSRIFLKYKGSMLGIFIQPNSYSLITLYQLTLGKSPQMCLLAKVKWRTLLILLNFPTWLCLITLYLLLSRGA